MIIFGSTGYRLTKKNCQNFFEGSERFAYKERWTPYPDGWIGQRK